MNRFALSMAVLLGTASILATASVAAEPAALPDGCLDQKRFNEVQERLRTDLEAAYAAAGRDADRAGPALDAVVAKYQPCWDAFADDQQRRFERQVMAAPAAERDAKRKTAAPFFDGIRSHPRTWRDQIVRNGDLGSPPPPPPPR